MAGELSPDRLYYWDGLRWASAVSPDGAWRWDGHSWQATRGGSARRGRTGPIIAAVVIAALVVGSYGAYQVAMWALARTQSVLQASGVTVNCSDSHARAGASISEGDLVCGRHLGMPYYSTDCAELTGTPPGGQFLDSVNNGDWQTVDVVPSTSGCRLEAKPGHEAMFSTADNQAASSTLIVDFVAAGWQGRRGRAAGVQPGRQLRRLLVLGGLALFPGRGQTRRRLREPDDRAHGVVRPAASAGSRV